MEKVKKFIALLGVFGLMALLSLGSVAAFAAEPETAVSWRFYESEALKEEVTDIAVSPDGESVSFITEDGEEYVVDELTDEQFEQVSEDIKSLNDLDSTDEKKETSDNNTTVYYKKELTNKQKLVLLVLFAIIILFVWRALSHDDKKRAIYPTIDLVCAATSLVTMILVGEGIIPV